MGIGRIPDAVISALADRNDLGIHTEMMSDGAMRLIQSGVVTGRRKKLLPGKAVTSFIMGSREMYQWCTTTRHRDASLELHERPVPDFAQRRQGRDQLGARHGPQGAGRRGLDRGRASSRASGAGGLHPGRGAQQGRTPISRSRRRPRTARSAASARSWRKARASSRAGATSTTSSRSTASPTSQEDCQRTIPPIGSRTRTSGAISSPPRASGASSSRAHLSRPPGRSAASRRATRRR